MFVTESAHQNGFDKIILKDDGANTFVEIIPSCGALLHSFNVFIGGSYLNIIDNYDDAADFRANVASKGFKSCKLSPFACRINNARYSFGEQTYTIQKYLSGENALHGLLYDANFVVSAQYADESKAAVSLAYFYRGGDKGYPFDFDCLVNYELAKNNSLSITTEIVNKDKGLIPVQDGWHPYFSFGGPIDDLQLEFQSREILIFDDELIPTGELIPYHGFTSLKKIGDTTFDNCFTLNFAECQPLCVLRDASKKIQLEVRPGRHYPYLQIYTPPHRRSIAIENLSAAPNAFNNKIGLVVLQPEENITFTTTFKITSLI